MVTDHKFLATIILDTHAPSVSSEMGKSCGHRCLAPWLTKSVLQSVNFLVSTMSEDQ